MKKNKNVNYAKVIKNCLNEVGINFSMGQHNDETIFTLLMAADNAPGLNVKLIVNEHGDSKLRCYLASDVAEEKCTDVALVINKLNTHYRYVCLSIDDDRDICASYDFVLFGNEDMLFAHVFTLIFMYSDICDKCIPAIMQTIWNISDDKRIAKVPEKFSMNLFDDSEGDDE